MKRVFLLCIAVVRLILGSPNLLQPVFAQVLPGPTVDERYRDANDNERAPAAELPLLNPPQSKSTLERRQPDKTIGPAFLGVTFNTDNSAPVVKSITPGSPAEQAGLQPTDVIETIQGWPVKTYQDVLDVVAKMRPGELLDVEFSRRLSVRTQVALASLPAAARQSVGYPPDDRADSEHELLPVPAKKSPSSRSTMTQHQSGNASGQHRNDYRNFGPSNDNRGPRGRLGRQQ